MQINTIMTEIDLEISMARAQQDTHKVESKDMELVESLFMIPIQSILKNS